MPIRTVRPGRMVAGSANAAVVKFAERTLWIALEFSELNRSTRAWMRLVPNLNALDAPRSSWLVRSGLVWLFPGVNGIVRDDAVILGTTSAPGVHGPRHVAAYRVVGLISQIIVPAP